MNRRSFLASLFGAAAGLTLDPEKLLWVPGRKLISIPRPSRNRFIAPEFLTREILDTLGRNLTFARLANLQYDDAFASGHALQFRRPFRF